MASNNQLQIKTTQFKRGLKSILEARLTPTDLGVLLAGEPAFETDTGQLKIGNGVSAYIDLPYIGGNAEDSRFIINDPVGNQVLLYDKETQSWVNKDLADKESIIYLSERGLTIKGYENAQQGYMLVKDQNLGLTWVKPLDDSRLQEAITSSETAASEAKNAATAANSALVGAQTAAGNAQAINKTTMSWVNNKFWWGSIEEYNTHISENGLNPGTFYFITPEK